jgi:hypothetical protein
MALHALTDQRGIVIVLLLGLPPDVSEDFKGACRLAHQRLLQLKPTKQVDRTIGTANMQPWTPARPTVVGLSDQSETRHQCSEIRFGDWHMS